MSNQHNRKLLSFVHTKADFDKVRYEINNGWSVVNLVKHNEHYIAVLEKTVDYTKDNKPFLFIYPKKKLKFKK